jgi:20S proteasome alpha/beta subunit
MEAISNAGSCVGILAKDGIVLAAEKKITTKVHHVPNCFFQLSPRSSTFFPRKAS